MDNCVWEDSRGWRYKVMPGLGHERVKARYNKPGSSGWDCVRTLPWRDNPEAAENDLTEYAGKKRMRKVS